MKKLTLLFFAFGTLNAMAQTYDLAGQLRIIRDLLPNSARLGMLYNPSRPNIEALISNASQDTGLVIIKSPVANARDMTNAVRALTKYNVDFIFMIDDKVITGAQTIKFVVKQTMNEKVPVFTTSENAFPGGAFGWLIENGSSWRIKINGNIRDKFNITIPNDTSKFVIE